MKKGYAAPLGLERKMVASPRVSPFSRLVKWLLQGFLGSLFAYREPWFFCVTKNGSRNAVKQVVLGGADGGQRDESVTGELG